MAILNSFVDELIELVWASVGIENIYRVNFAIVWINNDNVYSSLMIVFIIGY